MSVRADGVPQKSGAYVLELAVETPLELVFGRFQGGRVFTLKPGCVYYLGSALGGRLPSRLLRHATRAAGPPHRLRAELLHYFAGLGYTVRPPTRKTLHWHVDHLMESPAELAAVSLFYGEVPREAFLEEALRALGAEPLAPGLGAGDRPGGSHVLWAPGPLPLPSGL